MLHRHLSTRVVGEVLSLMLLLHLARWLLGAPAPADERAAYYCVPVRVAARSLAHLGATMGDDGSVGGPSLPWRPDEPYRSCLRWLERVLTVPEDG